MNVIQSDSVPYHGPVGADAPPHWAQLLIDKVQTMRNELQRANLPRMKEDIADIRDELTAANLPQIQDDIATMKKDLRSLPTKSYVSAKLKEEIKPVKVDVNGVRKALDSVKEDVTAVAPGRLERTIAFTNKLYIDSTTLSNRMKVQAHNLKQVPAPDGTLLWNTRVRGSDGEEIVLPPLISTDAVLALEASQLGAYVRVYYPGREVPEDLTERKRLVLQAIGRSCESYEIV